ncbi:hypothetical protein N9Y17_04775, partial [Gammaproteobacteria bacterium]|nr:hypothetical protein [Gammaproteobacteria bacterium]
VFSALLQNATAIKSKDVLLAIAVSTNASAGNLKAVAESASNLGGEGAQAVFSALLQKEDLKRSKDILLAIAGSTNASEGNPKIVAESASKLGGEDAQAVFSKLLQNDAAKKTPEVINIIGDFVLPKAEIKIKTNSQTGAKFTISSVSAFMSGVVLIQNALVSAAAMGAVGGFMLLTHLICFLIEKANPAKAWVQYVMPLLEVGLTALVVYYLPALLPLAGFSLVMSPQMWLLMVPVGVSCLTRWLCQLCTSDKELNNAYNSIVDSSKLYEGNIQITSYDNVSEDLQILSTKIGPLVETSIT